MLNDSVVIHLLIYNWSPIPIFAVEITKQAKHFQTIDYPHELALIFGHERNGVNEFILDMADQHIYIPMNGKKKSLNVAISAGIVMYEAIKK